jgi:predicted ATPase
MDRCLLREPDLREAVPLFAGLLSIPTGDRYPPLNLTPQKQREKTLHAQLAQVEGLAAQQPVLMVWEDVHWSDPTTRESLDLIIDRAATLRVLVIITFRPEFAPPWIGRPHVTLLILSRLPPRRRAEMIRHVTGSKALPREIADQIADRTDSVPLFIEELTKTVVESGIVTEARGHFVLKGPIAPLAIPTSLHASLLARLDRLAPTRELAQIGAALGRSFSYELISAVSGMSPQQLDDALAQLVSAELIFKRRTPPDSEYTFKHALVQDAAYSTLLKSRRQQIHGRIAMLLEEKFPDIVAAQPALLAQHCAEAGMANKAVGYWLKAGQQSIARCAMAEAVAQLENGLTVLAQLPDGGERQEQELDLQITLGHALMAAKGLSAPEAGDAFARAHQLCQTLGHPGQLGSVLIGQLMFRIVRDELEQAEHHAEQIRHLGEDRNDAMWRCYGSFLSGCICYWLGKFTDARSYIETALPSWRSEYRAFAASPDDPYVQALLHLSRALTSLGYIDKARFRRDQAVVEARRISPYNVVFALGQAFHGVDWAINGLQSSATTMRSADEVVAVSSEQGFPLWLGIGNVMRGWCLGTQGKAAEGIPLIHQGTTETLATGCKITLPFALMALAELHGMAGAVQIAALYDQLHMISL